MSLFQFLRRIPKDPRSIEQIFRKCVYSFPTIGKMWLKNRFHKGTLTDPNGPVVCMTTYGTRISTVYLTIESIGRGRVLPSRIILWLDEKPTFDNLPRSLRRLKRRGLEIRLCENYRPHKKYFPFIMSETEFTRPLVTADDDELYPETWLQDLVEANQQYPDAINCHWGVRFGCDASGIGKYSTWERCGSVTPSFRNFALGICGVIYPPEFLRVLKQAGDGFKDSCPMADDVWLHVHALRAGFRVRQVRPEPPRGMPIPGSQATALTRTNFGHGNDVQIAATYSTADLAKLTASSHRSQPAAVEIRQGHV